MHKDKSYRVFFDDFCVVCNAFALFLLRKDTDGRYRVGGFSGEAIKGVISVGEIARKDTVIVVDGEGRVYRNSDAAIEAVAGLGGAWVAVSVLALIPRRVRDFFYRQFSKWRVAVFGRKNVCDIQISSDSRFLP